MSIDLNHMPSLRDVIDTHELQATKSLGQNFLLDLNVTRKIVRAAGDLSGVHAIEIGPGPGGLTRALVESDAASVTAIEYDPRAIGALQGLVEAASGKLTLIQGDALTVDCAALTPAPRAIVANLPYNIATPLLIGWLRQIDDYRSLTLMFQKEVAQRITAKPDTEHYGRLAVVSNWLCKTSMAMDLHPRNFTPPPKVTSTVAHLVPRTDADRSVSFSDMERCTAAAFGQRRKMLRQSLKPLFADRTESVLERCGIAPTARAETVDVDGFIRLAKMIKADK